ncbi:MAG: hypothetical protein ABSB82_20955 [Terriglobia bacterium]
MATIVGPGGGSGSGGDWTQGFCTVNCAGAPNAMALTELQFVMETAGVTFNELTTAQPGWSTAISYDGGTGIYIYGPPTLSEIDFTLGFSSDPSVPFTFVAQLWSGTTFDAPDSAAVYWSGSAWSFGSLGSPEYGEAAEPSIALLLGFQFLGIGLAVLRRVRV